MYRVMHVLSAALILLVPACAQTIPDQYVLFNNSVNAGAAALVVTFGHGGGIFGGGNSGTRRSWGSYSQAGQTTTFDTWFAGYINSPTFGLPTGEYRDWFAFSIPDIGEPYTTVVLHLIFPLGGVSVTYPGNTETWTLFDVSSSTIPKLLSLTTGDPSIFVDLGSGTVYGTYTVNASSQVPIPLQVDFPLNSAAVAAINAARGGAFAIGGAVTSIDAAPRSGPAPVPTLSTGMTIALGSLLVAFGIGVSRTTLGGSGNRST
jgi:hypothetical protein